MAVLKKNVLGEVRGKIGNIVGKIRNGKHYIASVPSQYTMSRLPHEVDKRNRFRVNGIFAKAIRENELLYSIWHKEKAPAGGLILCMKHNLGKSNKILSLSPFSSHRITKQ
jgi:hypothetical protein